MNPGSGQFASQFPDAEETMSKMESKKLQTIEGFSRGPWWIDSGDDYAIRCDWTGDVVAETCEDGAEPSNAAANARLIAAAPDLYRIAHEQREVIRRLERELAHLVNLLRDPRRLEKELAHLVNLLRDPIERYSEITVPGLATLNGARAALEAAAPFLED